jgi:hypothetical protein
MACDNCSCGADAKAACASGASSARLPPRAKKLAAERASIWSTSTAAASEEHAPLINKSSAPGSATGTLGDDDEAPVTCEARCGGRNQCCRDLKAEDRHLLNPDIVRDIIIGLSDGLTVRGACVQHGAWLTLGAGAVCAHGRPQRHRLEPHRGGRWHGRAGESRVCSVCGAPAWS